jgi:hypothetical protein
MRWSPPPGGAAIRGMKAESSRRTDTIAGVYRGRKNLSDLGM